MSNIPTSTPTSTTDLTILTDLPDKKLLRVDEAAKYFDVNDRTIREWIRKKKLPAEKLAGTVRIPRQSIIDFRLSGKTVPNIT